MIQRALMSMFTLFIAFCSTSAAAENGFKSIFDGKTLKGWEGRKDVWSVKDGALTGATTKGQLKGNTFLIWQGGDVADFELHLKFRIKGGNSGIQYRSEHVKTGKVKAEDYVVKGYQADFEAGTRYIGILYEERGRGILATRGQKVTIGSDGKKTPAAEPTLNEKEFLASIKKEDWNDYVIIAKGNHLVQKINGHTTIDVVDNQSSRAKKKGILAFQCHQGPPMVVQFKDVKIKRLK